MMDPAKVWARQEMWYPKKELDLKEECSKLKALKRSFSSKDKENMK